MEFSDKELDLLVKALEAQRAAMQQNLRDLEILIGKTKNGVVSDNAVYEGSVIETGRYSASSKRRKRADVKFDYFEKIKWALMDEDTPLTSREILTRLYSEYPDEIDEKEDRKHIAAVSTVLYGNVPKEVEIIRKEKEQNRFKIKRNVSFEADQFEKELLQKQIRVDPSTELPF